MLPVSHTIASHHIAINLDKNCIIADKKFDLIEVLCWQPCRRDKKSQQNAGSLILKEGFIQTYHRGYVFRPAAWQVQPDAGALQKRPFAHL